MIFNSPASDQIEVSLFGPGYGECVVLHAGAGDWIIIDCCIDTRSGEVAPLHYVQELGVEVEKQVKHIVASHWHDDHTRGLSRLVEACSNARFWRPMAMTEQEFIQYAELYAETFRKQATGGTTEISRVLSGFVALQTRLMPQLHQLLEALKDMNRRSERNLES
jgi:glyoxylase-like metal-dependent hydrolase (beta-lactamase superfamily II)